MLVNDVRSAALWVVSFAMGLAIGCGSGREQPICYDAVDRTDFDPEFGEVWVCDELLPIARKHPEFTDADVVLVELPREGECPMCAEDLDPLFWQAFLDQVNRLGLAPGEDPNCTDDGYAIEIACRTNSEVSHHTGIFMLENMTMVHIIPLCAREVTDNLDRFTWLYQEGVFPSKIDSACRLTVT